MGIISWTSHWTTTRSADGYLEVQERGGEIESDRRRQRDPPAAFSGTSPASHFQSVVQTLPFLFMGHSQRLYGPLEKYIYVSFPIFLAIVFFNC